MWNFIRNLLNPKRKRPEHCICPEEDFRYWTVQYLDTCPRHKHHVISLASKCKKEELN